ncbi:hypothetical protein GCM10028802_17010 [Terrabacter terrigena]
MFCAAAATPLHGARIRNTTWIKEPPNMFAALLSALAANDFATRALLTMSSVWGWGG